MVNIITVDDTNDVQLRYDDKWFHGNWTDNTTQPPSNRSLLSSNFVTAQMVLVFPVAGTGFSYYGMKRSGGGSFRICIDCDPHQPAGPFDTIDAFDPTDRGQSPPVLLYSKQGLKNDMHMVVLMNTNDTRVHPEGASQITVDRFEITVEDPPVSTVQATVIGGATVSVGPVNSRPSSVSPGLIAGVVVGVVTLLSLLALLFFFWRRKRRITLSTNMEEGRTSRDALPDPLVIYRPQHGHQRDPSGSTLPLMSSTTSTNDLTMLNAKGSATSPPTQESRFSRPSSSDRGGPASTSSSSAPLNTLSSRSNRRIETDAGPVLEQEETLPPDYAQVFSVQPVLDPLANSSSASTPENLSSTSVPTNRSAVVRRDRKRL